MSVTRRSVLLGAVVAAGGLVVTGCKDDDEAPPAAGLGVADRASLAAAIDAERRIVALYDALPDNAVAGATAREQHAAHLAALRRLDAGATPPATPASPVEGRLKPLVVQGAGQLQAAAVAAVDGALSAVLASIAASHLTPPPPVFESEWWGGDPS
jgi:hypothetical protein